MSELADVLTEILAAPRPVNRNPYVVACCYNPKTYGLGRIQHAIIDHLATTPDGFDGGASWSAAGELKTHGLPAGVTVRDLTGAVYSTPDATPNQLRTVQRNVRRLEALHLVDCWRGEVGARADGYQTRRGFTASMPVAGLYVALRWHCSHLPEETP